MTGSLEDFILLRCPQLLQVLQSAVDELHTRYYEAIADLFRRHQPGFPGYEDVKLRIE